MKYYNTVIRYIEDHDLFNDDLIEYSSYMYLSSGMKLINSFLLYIQRPGLGFAASEKTWNEYGRIIKPGANPLIVLLPFGPVDFYYEACDTYSEDNRPLEDWMCGNSSVIRSEIKSDNGMSDLFQFIRMALECHGVYYSEKEYGMRQGAQLSYIDVPITVTSYIKKKTIEYQTCYCITVNSRSDTASKVTSICHEIGHLLCGHVGIDYGLKKNSNIRISVPERNLKKISRESTEFEAEKTCELIMSILGYRYDSREYLQDYLIDGKEPPYDEDAVIAAADEFLYWLRETVTIYMPFDRFVDLLSKR